MSLALAAACSCEEAPADPQPQIPEGLILEFDGLRIWEHEVEPLLQYQRSLDSRTGPITLRANVLDTFLIPLKLAQREFPEQRAAKRALAEGLSRAVGNEGYPGLLQKGRRVAGEEPDKPVPAQRATPAARDLGLRRGQHRAGESRHRDLSGLLLDLDLVHHQGAD